MIWRWLDWAGDVLFLASAVAAVAFVVLYAARSAWRSTPVGRAVLGFMAIIATIMGSAILFGTLWRDGHDHLRLVFRVVLYGLLFGGLVRFIVLLLRAQRQDRLRRRRR